MLNEAYNLLENKYLKCFHFVKSDAFYSSFANEKKRHSFQVAGAGNYLVRHIEWLKNKSPEYIELVKTAIFLHDICRFDEIEKRFLHEKAYDHGIEGCNFLRQTSLFNDIRIWLPIKHHNHIIKDLYDDNEYQCINDKDIKKQVELISFIIRDADKIANLHMLVNEENVQHLFLGKSEKEYISKKDGIISDITRKEAFENKPITRQSNPSFADLCVTYLSWYTDINYLASINYCTKLNVTTKLINFFEKYCIDDDFKKRYPPHFMQYIHDRTYLL